MTYVSKAAVCELAVKNLQDVVQLTSDLIAIPSENPTGSQRPVIDFVKNYLTDAGIEFEELASNPNFPCVVAKMGSDEGFSIILNGHVDVVPAGELTKWNFEPYCGTITEDKILGRGTSDMKAGVAGLLFAMKTLKESGAALKGNIRLHIVSDEESGGQYGSKWLCENGYSDNADACLIAEPTGKDDIEIGQKGGLEIIVAAEGMPAHGSLGGFKGDNAILKMARVLDKFADLTQIKGSFTADQLPVLKDSKHHCERAIGVKGVGEVIEHVSCNVGIISGGTRPNMVPDACEAILDCRLPIGVNNQEIIDMVDDILAQNPGVTAQLNWKSEPNFTDPSAVIVQTVKKYSEEVLGFKVVPKFQWASSDARVYRKLGIPTIQFGPANTEGIHSYNENVDISDVENSAKIYVLALCEMLGIE